MNNEQLLILSLLSNAVLLSWVFVPIAYQRIITGNVNLALDNLPDVKRLFDDPRDFAIIGLAFIAARLLQRPVKREEAIKSMAWIIDLGENGLRWAKENLVLEDDTTVE